MATVIPYPQQLHAEAGTPSILGGAAEPSIYEAIYQALYAALEGVPFPVVRTEQNPRGIKTGPDTAAFTSITLNEVGSTTQPDTRIRTHVAISTSYEWKALLEFNEWVSIDGLRAAFKKPPVIQAVPAIDLPAMFIMLASSKVEHPRKEQGAIGTRALLTFQIRPVLSRVLR